MIWKFTLPGVRREHYLMGTMHLASKEAYTFAELAMSCMQNCQTYAAEMDIEELESAQLDFTLPDSLSNQILLGEKKYRKVGNILQRSFGIEWAAYNHTLPFFITSMLSIKCARAVYPATLDQYLWQEAKRRAMATVGLESLENQRNVLQAIPLDFQVKEMKTICRNVGAFRHRMYILQQLYARNDWELLYRQTRKQSGKIRKCMLHERNERMVESILRLIEDTSLFVAVGASHLGGDIGLLAALKKKGAKCIQIT